MTEQRIKINGELFTVSKVYDGDLPEIETEEGESFILAEDSEEAGKKAREYWENLAQDDPKEFTCMVGEETLVQWGLELPAGPGYNKVRSLQDWLDLWLNTPEEQWAGYDSEEREVDRVGNLSTELGFTPTVAYRSN